MVKKNGLTASQSSLWDAVTSSEHSLNTICKRSGYSCQSLINWMGGIYEPSKFAFETIIESIKSLESESVIYMNWRVKKAQLIDLKSKGLSNKEIASRMNTTKLAIERASLRFKL